MATFIYRIIMTRPGLTLAWLSASISLIYVKIMSRSLLQSLKCEFKQISTLMKMVKILTCPATSDRPSSLKEPVSKMCAVTFFLHGFLNVVDSCHIFFENRV